MATRRRALVTLAEQFGEGLRQMRRHRGYSQETLARVARLHRGTVHLLESGKREPRLETIVVLADALSIDPGLLVAGLRP